MRKAHDKQLTLGSIHRDEVLPVREVARRLGWSRPAIVKAQRNGLRTCRVGRFMLTTGEAVFEYVEKLMHGEGSCE
jgi:hypothetical protein